MAVAFACLLFCPLLDGAAAMRIITRSSIQRRTFLSGGVAAAAATMWHGKGAVAEPPAPGSLGARVEELKMLGTRVEQSGKVEVPEFWAGRLQGQPPPTPKIVLRGDDVPPFVILPGFGNDQVDYVTPNGLTEEVGLAAALERRGISSISVVPIKRADWLNVARGLTDLSFVAGNAQPEGPAFSWYVIAAKATVERAVAARRTSIDAAADLMSKHKITHHQVSSVEIKTFHNATRLAGHHPKTADEFAYSIAFPVACMIVRGQIGPAELAAETLKDPEILRISNATQLIDDPHLTQISEGKRWAQVSLRLRDGRICESPPRSPRGDVDMPLTDAEISQKFHLFADPILGVKNAEILETLCADFDQLDAPGLQSLLELVLSKPQI